MNTNVLYNNSIYITECNSSINRGYLKKYRVRVASTTLLNLKTFKQKQRVTTVYSRSYHIKII